MTISLPDTGLWFRRFLADPETTPDARVVCFPHAGGAASYFAGLSRRMRPSVDVVAVQYPGRQDRRAEPGVTDLAELAAVVADELAAAPDLVRPGVPLALFGHSMGATVAYEVARRLEHVWDIRVDRLVVSARCAPSDHRSAGIHRLDDEGVLAEVRRLSGTGDGLLDDDEMVRMVLPTLRADYTAAETYSWAPGPAIGSPIDGLCGDGDPRVGPTDLSGWGAHTTGEFTETVVPGGHFYFGDDPEPIAALLTDRLRLT